MGYGMISGPIPGHESVTADETNETKHNIRRKNFVPIKIAYGFVKPPKTSNAPARCPSPGRFYLCVAAGPRPLPVTSA